MSSICGANCEKCYRREKCNGCVETFGSPFGGKCVSAKMIMSYGEKDYIKYKKKVAEKFNALNIVGMPPITDMFEITGNYINLEFSTPGGIRQKFLSDIDVYLANQVEEIGKDGNPTGKYFGVVASENLMIVARYQKGGYKPELVKYIKYEDNKELFDD